MKPPVCIATISFQNAYSWIIDYCKNIENFCKSGRLIAVLWKRICILYIFYKLSLLTHSYFLHSTFTLIGSDAAMRPNAIVRSSASLQVYNTNQIQYCSIHCKVLQVYCIVSIISWFVTTFSHQSLRRWAAFYYH